MRWGKDFCRFRPEKRKEFRVATGNALLLGKETTDDSEKGLEAFEERHKKVESQSANQYIIQLTDDRQNTI